MKVILFGATGMVGQGALRECLLDPDVEAVLVIGRNPTGRRDAKLREIIHADLFDLSAIEPDLTGYDTCLFCLGVSSLGMNEADYRRITHDMTLAVATVLARLNPAMSFVYVTGQGCDSTEQGKVMWARVKGKTENDLLKLPFRAAYMFRPGGIEPLNGVTTKTAWLQAIYNVSGPLWRLLHRVSPNHVTTTEKVGRAMLRVVRHGYPSPLLETVDINKVGA